MGLPRILRAKSNDDPVYEGGPDGIPLPIPERMPRPRVAMMWVPQSFGSPNIPGNQPEDYWPGGKYVDWVGIDIYSKYAGAFDDGVRFFNRYDKWPFVIGEYGPWDNDFGGSFTGGLFRWAEAHERVKMMIYYRGVDPANNYNVQYYPGAQKALRNHLAEPHWDPFAPGVKALDDRRCRRCRRAAATVGVPGAHRSRARPSARAAVDLRVGPAAELADLGVGVALGLEHDRAAARSPSAPRAPLAPATRSRALEPLGRVRGPRRRPRPAGRSPRGRRRRRRAALARRGARPSPRAW